MSDKLFRISTPTIKYTIDDEFDMSRVASSRFIICNMGNKNLIVKENPVIEDMSFKVNLTQEDTKKLNAGIISAQIHILLNNHKVIWTDIAKTTMNGVLGEDMFDVPDYSADTGEYEIDFHGTVSDYDVPLHGHLDVTLEGSTVIPNPEGEATDDLTKVEIDGEIFLVKDSTIHDWARAEEKPTYTKAEVGLGNVDNTSDLNKPVSTATQAALDLKADSSSVYTKTETDTLLNNKVDKDGDKVLSDNNYSDTDKSIVGGVTSALADKVDKVEGYGLSKNDYTDEEKAKVGEIDNKLDKTETAVNSNGLVIATPVTDTAPYIYRQTPVKESFKALMKKIVGASVVWNQYVDSNNFPSVEDTFTDGVKVSAVDKTNGTVTITVDEGGATATRVVYGFFGGNYIIPANHQRYLKGCASGGSASKYGINLFGSGGGTGIWDYGNGKVNSNASTCYRWGIAIFNGCPSGTYTFKPQVFDLTAMFGTTIADYVYTLETSQSGSGIAWLQSYGFFTEDYYAYKQNKLESGCVSAKKVWNNIFNVPINSGYTINPSGEYVANNIRSATEEYIRVEPNKEYILQYSENYNNGVHFYTEDKTYIDLLAWDSSPRRFTTPSNAYYVRFSFSTIYAITNVELLDSTSYPISPITLRGIFKLSTDKLTVDGDEYNADGSVTRKYGIVDLGSLDWTMSTLDRWNTTGLRNLIKKPSGLSEKADIVAEQYKTVSSNDLSGDTTLIGIECNIYGDVKVRNGSTTEKPHGKIAYKLATPTTEQTTPFTETEIVGSTEEFIDYEVAQDNRDVAIPVGTETDYYQEMKLPSLPTTSGNHNLIYNPSTGFGWS